MKKELEDALVKDFPKLYGARLVPVDRSKPFLTFDAFGFECEDGWEPIIRELSTKLAPYRVLVMQVKEKFGGLRFYIGAGSDEVYKLIQEAENKSYKTCEFCGQPGELERCLSWIRTLCDKCARAELRKTVEQFWVREQKYRDTLKEEKKGKADGGD